MADSHTNDDANGPRPEGGAWHYCATRVSSLKPPMNKIVNPFSALRQLTLQHWLFFLV